MSDHNVEHLTIANRAESLARRLEDLEDAYGPTIRKARNTPGCTDIMINEDGVIWLTMGGDDVCTNETLPTHALRRIVSLVSDIDGKPIRKASLNANLPTGERFAALLPPTVTSIRIAIRLPAGRVFTLEEYVSAGIMTEKQCAVLKRKVAGGENILVVGSMNAGKSTLGNGLLAEDEFKRKWTFIIQDQDELKISGPKAVRAFIGEMTARELVKEGLRQNMKKIVIGEIRDGETAKEWIDACNTGHPGLSTIHANSAKHALARISSLIGHVVVNVPHMDIVNAIGCIVFIRKNDDGTRTVVEVVEPTGHDGREYLVDPLA